MKIEAKEEKEPLLDILVKAYPDSSKTTVRSWIKLDRVQVNGIRVSKPAYEVVKGAIVEVLPKPKPKSGPIEILFEDDHLIVIHKPFGLLSVDLDSDRGSGGLNSAHSWLKRRHPGEKIYVIHRLDRETSGVMIFARSEEAFITLKEALKKREVKRVYRTVVEGVLHGEGVWENYLVENTKTFQVRVSISEKDQNREWAKTYWKALASSGRYTLLECRLETGKKNQIRVQAHHRGYPVAGDMKYGATYSLDDIFTSRICLHAREIDFIHPVTQKPMKFVVPEPEFFTSLATSG